MGEINPTATETTVAQKRADRIRHGLEATATALAELPELVTQAYKAEDWRTLGYESWDDYVKGEYETGLLKLDAATRKLWTRQLKDAGMSTRQIAPVTNVNQATVVRDANASPPKTANEAKTADEKLLAHISQAAKALERIRDEINQTNVHDRNAQDGIERITELVKDIINAGARKETA